MHPSRIIFHSQSYPNTIMEKTEEQTSNVAGKKTLFEGSCLPALYWRVLTANACWAS